MILFFTPKITNRIQYIVKTILHDICGFEYTVTNSGEDFLNFKGARINYSEKDMPVDCITIYPSGFLSAKGVKEFTPEVVNGEKFKKIFPLKKADSKCNMGFDIFSASFYLLSRYEEYLPFLDDRYGRFEADQSLAYQKGFIDQPIVDLWAMELKDLLLAVFPFLEARKREFSFIPTYDIDVAYAYKGKGITRNAVIIARDILTLEFATLKERLMVLSGQIPDPFDTYDYQLELQKKYNLDPVYFFHCGQFGPRDRTISVHSVVFQKLVKKIGDYARCGIHPSYLSNSSSERLAFEIEILSGLLHRSIECSRQHYLKVKFPDTYQQLIKYNISSDFTMGYASHTGFRAGTCSVFSFYDLSLESETRLKIYPLALMDGTLRDYMKLKPADAIEKVREIVSIVKELNGCLISLWHNDALSNSGNWKDWNMVYENLLEFVSCDKED